MEVHNWSSKAISLIKIFEKSSLECLETNESYFISFYLNKQTKGY